ncbi:MAG: hypothetical protein R2932_26540 [Caldilineaceae bacterium]
MANQAFHPTICALAQCHTSWLAGYLRHADERQNATHLFHRHC